MCLLWEMWSKYDLWGDSSALLPDFVTYSTMILAYKTFLDQPHAIGCARDLLAELEGLAACKANGTMHQGGCHLHGFQPNMLTNK